MISVSVTSGQNTSDFDEDGLSDIIDSDDDNDLLPDGVEMLWGMNPMDPSDAVLDRDGDGLNALLEYATGGDPFVYDKVIQLDHLLKRLTVQEMLSSKTTSVQLGWSDNMIDWERAMLNDARASASQIVRSRASDWNSPLGMVKEWTFFLSEFSEDRYFRIEINSDSFEEEDLVVNGDFSEGADSWEFFENGASASYAVADGEAVISLTLSLIHI